MIDSEKILTLEPHGADAFVGESPAYEWGRIYGGLVIAQALRAAMYTVDIEGHHVHSLHAYFILGGDPNEPVRYEVDRLRNGRSFSTRRVVARQSGGAILNLSCSFQREEDGPDVSTSVFPKEVKSPEESRPIEWGVGLDARLEHESTSPARHRVWARFSGAIGDSQDDHTQPWRICETPTQWVQLSAGSEVARATTACIVPAAKRGCKSPARASSQQTTLAPASSSAYSSSSALPQLFSGTATAPIEIMAANAAIHSG